MREKILAALRWRYAVKIFDSTQKVSPEDLQTILEAGRLSPSSSGLEPWKFLVIENPAIRAKLLPVSDNQPKVTEASHLIVITRPTNLREQLITDRLERTAKAQNQSVESLEGLSNSLHKSLAKKDDAQLAAWATAQTYIALGIMIETAALLGVDGGPMEGFQPDQVDAILGLSEQHLTSVTMLALGYRGNDPAALRPKVRRDPADAIRYIS